MSNESTLTKSGKLTNWLKERGLDVICCGFDYQGVEIIKVDANLLCPVSLTLYSYGFNYLRCQFAYDEAPGGNLVSVYYLVNLQDNEDYPEEVCIKVYIKRDNPKVPSVFWIWKTADFQERESYDMYGIEYIGHPHLKRILMPENWRGWPMRKDYVTPDFYELQDSY